MSTLKVDGIRSNSASSDAITLASDGTCTANITNRTNRNLIINGAMQVAQRGTSSTSAGYQTVDRFSTSNSGLNEALTREQVDVASGTTPYTLGFRKAFKITNGDNTADANDQSKINYIIESQDLACSGWDSVNSNSKVTLSFWVKSSVAQTFVVALYADDANKGYAFEYSATTSWTKITHTISGASGLTFNNDNGTGVNIQWYLYMGTDTTNNSFTYNAWGSYSGSSRSRDMTTTWQTTDDATFEITGVQLEVGSVATDFEHRSYGQELALCQRYYQLIVPRDSNENPIGIFYTNASVMFCLVALKTTMRATPTLDISNYTNAFRAYGSSGVNHSTVSLNTGCTDTIMLQANGDSGTAGYLRLFAQDGGQRAKIAVNAEL